jgi:hypothetical protein
MFVFVQFAFEESGERYRSQRFQNLDFLITWTDSGKGVLEPIERAILILVRFSSFPLPFDDSTHNLFISIYGPENPYLAVPL